MDAVSNRRLVFDRVSEWRSSGKTVGFVPTMGALHEGHLSLVRTAKSATDRVVASIFVNPLQFGPGEDYSRYPRPIEADRAALASAGCDLLYLPAVEEMYPRGAETRVSQSKLPSHLCGAFRPGHFEGVLTVVMKLFNQVRPTIAFFGQKDFQQTVVLRQMVRDLDLDLDLEIRVLPTVREPDGLALSSRNAYLSPDERSRAPALKRALDTIVSRFQRGDRDAKSLIDAARSVLHSASPIDIQYLTISDPLTLEPRTGAVGSGDVVALAAYLGRTRLIDNVLLP